MPRPIYTTTIELDAATVSAAAAFDYGKTDANGKSEHSYDGTRTFVGWEKPEVPKSFSIGLILGPSGSGKTLLLRQFGDEKAVEWDNVHSVLYNFPNAEEGLAKLAAVGLNSVPAWSGPYYVLSNGEKFRADLARKLETGAVVDEFTSVVDRTVAKSTCVSLSRYARLHNIHNLVLASCHYDILEWLQPDWWFDTATGELRSGRYLQRPPITVRIYQGNRNQWGLFKQFHYYNTGSLPFSSRCYIATVQLGESPEIPAAFVASATMPSGTVKNAWRACRTVVLPDFQGLGIGPRVSDAVAKIHLQEGKRYFSKTTSHTLGGWRDRPNSGWVPTSKYDPVKGPQGRFQRKDRQNGIDKKGFGARRGGYFSHEYIGAK